MVCQVRFLSSSPLLTGCESSLIVLSFILSEPLVVVSIVSQLAFAPAHDMRAITDMSSMRASTQVLPHQTPPISIGLRSSSPALKLRDKRFLSSSQPYKKLYKKSKRSMVSNAGSAAVPSGRRHRYYEIPNISTHVWIHWSI